jgi:hypothetical protein
MTVAKAQDMVLAIVNSIGDGIKDFAKAWEHPDVFKKWYFRGQIIGNIALEIVLAIFTGGSTLGAKVLAKVGKYFPKLKAVLDPLKDAAKKLDFGRGRKGSDGKPLTQQIDPDVDMDDSPTRDWYQTLAMARLITESHDAKNTPVDVLIPLLNKTLGAKSKAVKGYRKESLGKPGQYKIIQFAKKKRPATSEVDSHYTEKDAEKETPAPILPDKVIYNQDGIRIWHNYGNLGAAPGTPVEHAPIHFHISYKGKEYRAFSSGAKLKESDALPTQVLEVFKANKTRFNKIEKQIGSWFKYHKARGNTTR